MILRDRLPKTDNMVNLTDYSVERPEGSLSFFAYITFTDQSYILLSNIFTASRSDAHRIVLERFSDCMSYITLYHLYEDD